MINGDENKIDLDKSVEWAQLSPEQKREQRIRWWQSSIDGIKFIDKEARGAYKIRMQRLIDVYNIDEPDRVPVHCHVAQLPYFLYGSNYYTGIYNYDKTVEIYEKFNNEYAEELDCFFSPAMVFSGKALDILDYRLYLWPGHGLPREAAEIQFVEGEYMKANEYPELILNPSDFWMRVYLPRVFGVFESFRLLDSLTDIIEFPNLQFSVLTKPEILATLQKLIDVGKELQKRESILGVFAGRGLTLGYPTTPSCLCLAPFDVIGDTLRGTRGIMMDMYRRPDSLLEALDVIAKLQIKSVISQSNKTKGIMAFFPLHKGADGWMSQKQFDTFYWPSLKKVINGLIDEGIMSSLFAEGSYNTRLETINEFPKGMVHWSFDQTDMVKAKDILGDKCCIQGNVPSSLMITGTPAAVKEYSHQLIEICGRGGGFILSPGSSSSEVNLENFKAMLEAAKEFGVYQK
jgi:hypothetical protein